MSVLPGLARLELPRPEAITRTDVLAIYEALRPVMPNPGQAMRRRPARLERLGEVLGHVDAVILDAFGVINVGASPISGIHDFMAMAASGGIEVMVLTNGAGQGARSSWSKYREWGLALQPEQVVSSRDSLEQHLRAGGYDAPLATIGPGVRPLGVDAEILPGDAGERLAESSTIVFLGSGQWGDAQQEGLEAALADGSKQLLVANPDVSAPLGHMFSAEPGYWAARAMKSTGARVEWFGKPHTACFELVLSRLEERCGRTLERGRVAMIGDSLHTDVLGASAAGLKSVLLTGYGLFAEGGAEEMIERSGIVPDWIVPGI